MEDVTFKSVDLMSTTDCQSVVEAASLSSTGDHSKSASNVSNENSGSLYHQTDEERSVYYYACIIIMYYVCNTSSISNDEKSSHSGHKTYVVFEDSLLLLFQKCPLCSSKTSVTKTVIGTFLKIHQSCSNEECLYRYVWESQPMIKNMPLGNVILSSANRLFWITTYSCSQNF